VYKYSGAETYYLEINQRIFKEGHMPLQFYIVRGIYPWWPDYKFNVKYNM
jgi:hypothetical protein